MRPSITTTSERRRESGDASSGPNGTWTRRPSDVTATANARRSKRCWAPTVRAVYGRSPDLCKHVGGPGSDGCFGGGHARSAVEGPAINAGVATQSKVWPAGDQIGSTSWACDDPRHPAVCDPNGLCSIGVRVHSGGVRSQATIAREAPSATPRRLKGMFQTMIVHACTAALRRCRRLLVLTSALLTLIAPVLAGPASAVTILTGEYHNAEGFDTCASVTSSTLDAWWSGTPWFIYGTYLGGSGGQQVGCVAMSTATIQHAASTGWGLEPFWYGRQMPSSCTGLSFNNTISLNTSTAYSQGIAEANAAETAAQAFQYGTLDVIFYDLEAVGTSSTCIAASKSFINGWSYQLQVNSPYYGSLYGSTCSSQLSSFSTITYPPYSIAPRDTSHSPNGVYGLLCLADSLWNNHHRVHQLAAQQHKTYGGVTLWIDEDCADARINTNRSGGFEINNCAKL
jgi:hypothetical protein